MAIQVKICGLTTTAAAEAAMRAQADFVGVVFHGSSPRNLGLEQAAAIVRPLRGSVRVVALMVDPSDDLAAAVTSAVAPDYFQLQGRETPARVGALVSRFGIAAIKGFGIAEAADLASVSAYDDVAEMFLLDAKAPANAVTPGGNGVAFDWQLLHGRRFARPWLLAGGLNPQNVARAIHVSGAPGVDASTGLESAPGMKDAGLIAAFAEAARNAPVGAMA